MASQQPVRTRAHSHAYARRPCALLVAVDPLGFTSVFETVGVLWKCLQILGFLWLEGV